MRANWTLAQARVVSPLPTLLPISLRNWLSIPVKQVHFEIGGVERNFKVYNPGAAASGTTPAVPAGSFSTEGGGGFVNLHVEPVKGFRLLTNNFWSDGGGRYIFGQAPDVIAHADGSLSPVHSGSTVTGFEFTQKKTLIYAYYGGIYIMRNTAIDTGKTTPTLGYGYSRLRQRPESHHPGNHFWLQPDHLEGCQVGRRQFHGPVLVPRARSLVREFCHRPASECQ